MNDSICIYRLTGENAFGLPTGINTCGVTRKYDYTPYGLPISRSVYEGEHTYQAFNYVFDSATSNLMSRTDMRNGKTEEFTYDNLNRLTSFGDNTITYDAKGNILEKATSAL
ncbi:MAG: hypothetical protein NC344_04785 [Bacteroidales bacterium]|nr:hypothetical protein [Bacteroidales bacterium]MCM1147141.1 hypothetical protein [Bacteroidales bacterium]MCM1205367.1 hypothetical protein [Bacillota bacterium]MCM1509828.1 hypothetical protein [Clostridium sp.]